MKGKLHTHTKNLNLGGASKLNHLNYHLLVIKLFFQRKYIVNDRKIHVYFQHSQLTSHSSTMNTLQQEEVRDKLN